MKRGPNGYRLWLRDESGQGLVEYAAIIVLMALALFVVVAEVGVRAGGVFERLTTLLNGAGIGL